MRRITDNLYIGDATDGRTRGHEFDRVVSMADSNKNTTNSFPIRDGDHDYTVFTEAVDVVVDGLNAGDCVLVHCRLGMSRSVAVSIAALVTTGEMGFEDAFTACRHGFQYPASQLLDSARLYCEAN